MSIQSITPHIPQIPSIKEVTPKAQEVSGDGNSFGQMFENALQEVNQLQTQADQQIEGLTLKKDGVTPHTAMVALEKADVAFQLMSAIRGKIVRAYEEVMRTQV